MRVVCDRGRFYYVRRVPKRYFGFVCGVDGRPVSQVRFALRTDSRVEAQRKAGYLDPAISAQWEALAAGNPQAAWSHGETARRIAAAPMTLPQGYAPGFPHPGFTPVAPGYMQAPVGFPPGGYPAPFPPGYTPMPHAIPGTAPMPYPPAGPVPAPDGHSPAPEVPPAMSPQPTPEPPVPDTPTLLKAFEEWARMTRTDRAGKSEAQAKRWDSLRRHVIKSFDTVIAADSRFPKRRLRVGEITRAHALAYREAALARVEAGEITPSAVNKHFGILSKITSGWAKLSGQDLANPFAGLRLKPGAETP